MHVQNVHAVEVLLQELDRYADIELVNAPPAEQYQAAQCLKALCDTIDTWIKTRTADVPERVQRLEFHVVQKFAEASQQIARRKRSSGVSLKEASFVKIVAQLSTLFQTSNPGTGGPSEEVQKPTSGLPSIVDRPRLDNRSDRATNSNTRSSTEPTTSISD